MSPIISITNQRKWPLLTKLFPFLVQYSLNTREIDDFKNVNEPKVKKTPKMKTTPKMKMFPKMITIPTMKMT